VKGGKVGGKKKVGGAQLFFLLLFPSFVSGGGSERADKVFDMITYTQ
jgi:hypothetical protein